MRCPALGSSLHHCALVQFMSTPSSGCRSLPTSTQFSCRSGRPARTWPPSTKLQSLCGNRASLSHSLAIFCRLVMLLALSRGLFIAASHQSCEASADPVRETSFPEPVRSNILHISHIAGPQQRALCSSKPSESSTASGDIVVLVASLASKKNLPSFKPDLVISLLRRTTANSLGYQ